MDNSSSSVDAGAGCSQSAKLTESYKLFDHLCCYPKKPVTTDRPIPPTPTHTSCFVVIPITNDEVTSGIDILQQLLIDEAPDCKPFMIPMPKLHVSVCVGISINLNDEDELNDAKSALKRAVDNENVCKIKPALELNVEGVYTFTGSVMEDRVIYANVTNGIDNVEARLKEIHEAVKKEFEPMTTETLEKFPYHPHITIGLVSKTDTYKFPKTLWDNYDDYKFGTEPIGKISLLTRCETNPDVYRIIHEEQL